VKPPALIATITVIILFSAQSGFADDDTPQARPNILLILADDLGWGDTSCNNPDSPLSTPQIDRIAKEGIRFTNAHAPAAACTPTRYGLLTGRYPWRSYLKKHVLKFYAPAMITKDHTTIPSYLKSQGYRTAGFGKWHTGLDWTPVPGDPVNWRSHWNSESRTAAVDVGKGIDHSKPFKNAPTDIGFDHYFGTPSNCARLPFFIADNRVFGEPQRDKKGLMRDPSCEPDKVDDLYVSKAIDFIRTHEEEHSDSPFFVYLPLNAIHGAVDVPQRFKAKSQMSIREDKIFWANESVGKMLAALDRMQLAGDTLVIFSSDNGPLHSPPAENKGHQPTGPYRGVKSNVWDGGTRVPFLARWPGHIPIGTTTDRLLCLTDMLATIAALFGEPLSADTFPDSFNQLPALLNQKNAALRPEMVTSSLGGFLTIRQGKWKAIFGTKWTGGHPSHKYGGKAPKGTPRNSPRVGQLYNIREDPFETKDLWDSNPEVRKNLAAELERIQGKCKSDKFPR
jgi:arylsulfatase A